MEGRDDIPGFARRTVLKSAAVAAVGVGAFSGTASATTPDQINFCGCSQVCVDDEDDDNYQVVLAKETDDGWAFEIVKFTDEVNEDGEPIPLGNQFCYELTETQQEDGYKVVGAMGPSGGDSPGICNPKTETSGIWCNRSRCAEKAIEAFAAVECDDETTPKCREPGDVTIVYGRCGEPGREAPPGRDAPPGRQGQNGPPE